MQPDQARVCAERGAQGNVPGIPSARQSQGRLHPVPSKHPSPAHLLFSRSHDPGVPRALLRASCKRSRVFIVLS